MPRRSSSRGAKALSDALGSNSHSDFAPKSAPATRDSPETRKTRRSASGRAFKGIFSSRDSNIIYDNFKRGNKPELQNAIDALGKKDPVAYASALVRVIPEEGLKRYEWSSDDIKELRSRLNLDLRQDYPEARFLIEDYHGLANGILCQKENNAYRNFGVAYWAALNGWAPWLEKFKDSSDEERASGFNKVFSSTDPGTSINTSKAYGEQYYDFIRNGLVPDPASTNAAKATLSDSDKLFYSHAIAGLLPYVKTAEKIDDEAFSLAFEHVYRENDNGGRHANTVKRFFNFYTTLRKNLDEANALVDLNLRDVAEPDIPHFGFPKEDRRALEQAIARVVGEPVDQAAVQVSGTAPLTLEELGPVASEDTREVVKSATGPGSMAAGNMRLSSTDRTTDRIRETDKSPTEIVQSGGVANIVNSVPSNSALERVQSLLRLDQESMSKYNAMAAKVALTYHMRGDKNSYSDIASGALRENAYGSMATVLDKAEEVKTLINAYDSTSRQELTRLQGSATDYLVQATAVRQELEAAETTLNRQLEDEVASLTHIITKGADKGLKKLQKGGLKNSRDSSVTQVASKLVKSIQSAVDDGTTLPENVVASVGKIEEYQKSIDLVKSSKAKMIRQISDVAKSRATVLQRLREMPETLDDEVVGLRKNVTDLVDQMKKERERGEDLQRTLAREMASHRDDVTKLVRALWVKEPFDKFQAVSGRIQKTEMVPTKRETAVPRPRVPSQKARPKGVKEPPRKRKPEKKETGGGGTDAVWKKIMDRQRTLRF